MRVYARACVFSTKSNQSMDLFSIPIKPITNHQSPIANRQDIPDQPAGIASAYTKLMMSCFSAEPAHRPSMHEIRNRLRVLNARVNGGSSLGVCLGNMFSCGFGGRLNNDLKQFSTFSRNKDTTRPRVAAPPHASAQMNQYGSSQVAPPPRQAQVMSQQPPMVQQIQQIQVRQDSSPFFAWRTSCYLPDPRSPSQIKSNVMESNLNQKNLSRVILCDRDRLRGCMASHRLS